MFPPKDRARVTAFHKYLSINAPELEINSSGQILLGGVETEADFLDLVHGLLISGAPPLTDNALLYYIEQKRIPQNFIKNNTAKNLFKPKTIVKKVVKTNKARTGNTKTGKKHPIAWVD